MFCPGGCSVCALQDYCFGAVGWNVFYVCYGSWVYHVIRSTVSLLVLCLDDLPSVESEVLKYSTITLLLSISPFSSVNIFFKYLGVPMLSACVFIIIISTC